MSLPIIRFKSLNWAKALETTGLMVETFEFTRKDLSVEESAALSIHQRLAHALSMVVIYPNIDISSLDCKVEESHFWICNNIKRISKTFRDLHQKPLRIGSEVKATKVDKEYLLLVHVILEGCVALKTICDFINIVGDDYLRKDKDHYPALNPMAYMISTFNKYTITHKSFKFNLLKWDGSLKMWLD